jgi:hypothetical protein
MLTDGIGVDRIDRGIDDRCVVRVTSQTSLTMSAAQRPDRIGEGPELKPDASVRAPARRCYMKEWPGRL